MISSRPLCRAPLILPLISVSREGAQAYAGESRSDDGSAWEAADGGDCDRGVIRGGSWYDAPMTLRSASRFEGGSAAKYYFRGFRLARDIEK